MSLFREFMDLFRQESVLAQEERANYRSLKDLIYVTGLPLLRELFKLRWFAEFGTDWCDSPVFGKLLLALLKQKDASQKNWKLHKDDMIERITSGCSDTWDPNIFANVFSNGVGGIFPTDNDVTDAVQHLKKNRNDIIRARFASERVPHEVYVEALSSIVNQIEQVRAMVKKYYAYTGKDPEFIRHRNGCSHLLPSQILEIKIEMINFVLEKEILFDHILPLLKKVMEIRFLKLTGTPWTDDAKHGEVLVNLFNSRDGIYMSEAITRIGTGLSTEWEFPIMTVILTKILPGEYSRRNGSQDNHFKKELTFMKQTRNLMSHEELELERTRDEDFLARYDRAMGWASKIF